MRAGQYDAIVVGAGHNGLVTACYLARAERISYESSSLKINVALGELPRFRACPGRQPGPQHRGDDTHLPRPRLHRACV